MIYLRQFGAELAGHLRELRAERNWFGIGLLLLCTPLLFVATVLVDLSEIGPE